MKRIVKASFQEHLRTSSRRFESDIERAITLAKKRLGLGGVFTIANFADKRYESFAEIAQRTYPTINTGNAIVLPEQDLLVVKAEEVPTQYKKTRPHILAVGIPQNQHITPFRTIPDTIKKIKDLGGLVIAEHPFFKHGVGPYFQENPEMLEQVDAIEVPSGEAYLFFKANNIGFDWASEEIKRNPNLTTVASMDGHSFYEFCRLHSHIEMPSDYTILAYQDNVSSALRNGLRNRRRSGIAFLDKFPSLSTRAIGITGALNHLIDLIYIIKLAPRVGQSEKFKVDRPEVWKPYV